MKPDVSLHYTSEKLSMAVLGMARSTESLQERLAHAYIFGFHTLTTADFPPDLQSSYEEIVQALTNVPAQGDEGTVVATTRVMSDEDARKLIEQIVSLSDEINSRFGGL